MENSSLNRRKQYFIKKKFQTDFIIKFCVLVIAGSFISGLVIYLMSKSTVTTAFENSRLTIKSTADFILPAVLLGSAMVIVLIGLATVWITLFASHRIAGPLYRMEEDIEKVAAGNLKVKFHLRDNDELKRLAASLDKMTENLKSTMVSIKETVTELDDKATKEIKPQLERLKTAVNKFTT